VCTTHAKRQCSCEGKVHTFLTAHSPVLARDLKKSFVTKREREIEIEREKKKKKNERER